jgi:hypothetical protein
MPQPSQLTWLASAPLRARAPGPVSGRLSRAPPRREGGPLPASSRCLSAAGIRYCGHPSPARGSAPLAIGLPPAEGRRTARDATFRTHEIRPDWAPSLPRDRRCPHGPLEPLARRLPSLTGTGPAPRQHCHLSGDLPDEASTRVHAIRPPGLPLTRLPRMTRGRLRLFPGLRTHASRTRARTPGRGRALSTSPELCHQSAWTSPPICKLTQRVRPRVARTSDSRARSVTRPPAHSTASPRQNSASARAVRHRYSCSRNPASSRHAHTASGSPAA